MPRPDPSYGSDPQFDILSVIYKGGDDCRQEVLAMQLIYLMDQIFQDAKLPLWLRPYSVVLTSPTSGQSWNRASESPHFTCSCHVMSLLFHAY